MTVNTQKNDKALTVFVEGRLDTTTSPELEKVLDANLEGINDLTFDFASLEYISSSGLRVLLKAQKRMNREGSMKIVHVNELINEVFDVTGFSDILTIE